MKLGLRLPQGLGIDLRHDVVEAARTAEAAGYTSLWTYERLIFPQTPLEPYAPAECAVAGVNRGSLPTPSPFSPQRRW